MQRRIVSAVLSILTFAMCGSAFAAGLANLWLDVPFVPQQKDGCGAAAISMVMQYWERHQGQPEQPQAEAGRILRALYSGTAHGVYAADMMHYFQQNGYRAIAFAGDSTDLERELSQGRPLIAALKPESGSSLHYVVVAGLEQPQQLILINDPAQRKLLKVDQSQFEREWKGADHWTLLAVPEMSAR